jgi:glutathione-dependent peroxiredoxin
MTLLSRRLNSINRRNKMGLAKTSGKRVPQVRFSLHRDGQWQEMTTGELFAGRTVIVVALPGAYIPNASFGQVPRYNELAAVFAENGVERIVCLSVNDAFVMEAWAKELAADHILFLPDGNGAFTAGMGMLVDKSAMGLGARSRRYSMLVRDGVVEKMFVEKDAPGDPFKVSGADVMLNYLNPDARQPEFVTIFTREGCPFCARAKAMLDSAGLAYEEVRTGPATGVTRRTLHAAAGRASVPQVFISGRHIGGADDLEAYLSSQQPGQRNQAA